MLTNFIRKFRLSRAFKKLAREIVQLKRELLLELLEKTPTEGSLQTPLNHQPTIDKIKLVYDTLGIPKPNAIISIETTISYRDAIQYLTVANGTRSNIPITSGNCVAKICKCAAYSQPSYGNEGRERCNID